MSNVINNVLFDLDGTLADTAPDLANALNQLLKEQGRAKLPFAEIRPTVSNGGNFMIRHAFQIDEKSDEFASLRHRFLEIYSMHLADETTLFPGMENVLAQLETDQITWGVVTNKLSWLTTPLMEALNLQRRAGCIVSGDSVEQSKPHPAPMLHACKLLNCKPYQTVYIGDAQRDILAGRNAGMQTLVALYGYIDKDEQPETWGANSMIKHPLEILDWLNNYQQK